ncbi:MAG: hypothetical protein M1835_007654 [Candelina submexicana]|nr:MAG: hypothetical protein M1835_007654 [Candelina submexicana]
MGQSNLVKQVTFEDGTCWLARLRMPELEIVFGRREACTPDVTLGIEASTMKFFRRSSAHTRIPVPNVYYTETKSSNPVGAPFILMEYIHGTLASDMEGIERGTFGTPEQDTHLLAQMADIMVQMAACRFDKIGGINYDEKTGEFNIGVDVETGRGPFSTPKEYFQAVCDREFEFQVDRHVLRQRKMTKNLSKMDFMLPLLFKELMPAVLDAESDEATFGLANLDFGVHNILIDEQYNILAVIDLADVISAPLHVLAQVPRMSNLERSTPGDLEINPFAVERLKRAGPRIDRFIDMVRDAEGKVFAENGVRAPGLAAVIYSDGAELVRGLFDHRNGSERMNMRWINGFMHMAAKRRIHSNGLSIETQDVLDLRDGPSATEKKEATTRRDNNGIELQTVDISTSKGNSKGTEGSNEIELGADKGKTSAKSVPLENEN